MTIRTARIALAFLAATTFAAPALAQGIVIGPNGIRAQDDRDYRDGDRRGPGRDRDARREISEREAIRVAKGEGLREVDDVSRRRSSFVVDGTDRRGRDITVVVDSRSGDVVSVR